MQVTKIGIFDMQVCVPKNTTDEEVIATAEKENPCGTTTGWQIRKQGSKSLLGDDERVKCDKNSKNVHIMLDA